ncbi:MAG TPA: hypothetical protein VL614_15145 [Acetobacteraceae bacterium]|nr:hypothetical protein [Acetobacteraceae bacterium]
MKQAVRTRRTSAAAAELVARIHADRRLTLGPADIKWFLRKHEPHTMPVETIEGPPCMIIVRSAMPVSRAAQALFERVAPIGMRLCFVRGKHV